MPKNGRKSVSTLRLLFHLLLRNQLNQIELVPISTCDKPYLPVWYVLDRRFALSGVDTKFTRKY